ncbi:MAG TPA: type II toxin-antitoxin system VapC family toxin [Candidatus Nanoarchaeia archaeon]|nr:type II toxin-antitoxin system VapC family toxin [Candidatus Nanoarchaeia archaeon]
MTLVLDTSILIDIEHNNKLVLKNIGIIKKEHPDTIYITMISYFEFLLGIKEKKQHNQKKALEFLELFPVLSAGKLTATYLADLKYKYDKQGLLMSLADLLIASQVIENNMTLITRDRSFERIKEMDKIIL